MIDTAFNINLVTSKGIRRYEQLTPTYRRYEHVTPIYLVTDKITPSLGYHFHQDAMVVHEIMARIMYAFITRENMIIIDASPKAYENDETSNGRGWFQNFN